MDWICFSTIIDVEKVFLRMRADHVKIDPAISIEVLCNCAPSHPTPCFGMGGSGIQISKSGSGDVVSFRDASHCRDIREGHVSKDMSATHSHHDRMAYQSHVNCRPVTWIQLHPRNGCPCERLMKLPGSGSRLHRFFMRISQSDSLGTGLRSVQAGQNGQFGPISG